MSNKGMSSKKASEVKTQGQYDEIEFAKLIGVDSEYQNGRTSKKDVVDQNGDTHSVKGGQIRWQIFLYGMDRFKKDKIFKVMGGVGDGIGNLIYLCLNCFPDSFADYQAEKDKYKELLKSKIIALCGKLQEDDVFAAFLSKSMFNCGEVVYLTIKMDNKFHVFFSDDVIETLVEKTKRGISMGKNNNETDYQKVTFLYNNKNVGAFEIRHDSKKHYRQALFSLEKKPVFAILSSGFEKKEWGDRVVVYGRAIKKFEKKHKQHLKSRAAMMNRPLI